MCRRGSCNKTWKKWAGNPRRQWSVGVYPKASNSNVQASAPLQRDSLCDPISPWSPSRKGLRDLPTKILFRHSYANCKELQTHMALAQPCAPHPSCAEGSAGVQCGTAAQWFRFASKDWLCFGLNPSVQMLPCDIWKKGYFSWGKNPPHLPAICLPSDTVCFKWSFFSLKPENSTILSIFTSQKTAV